MFTISVKMIRQKAVQLIEFITKQIVDVICKTVWAVSSGKVSCACAKMHRFKSSCVCAKTDPGICSPSIHSAVSNDSVSGQ